MQITIQKQIGKANLTFVVEEDKTIDALVRASAFTTIPEKCGKCQGTDVVLDSTKADKFTYIKVRCQNTACRATSTMGSYQDGTGNFWKPFEIYKKGDDNLPV